MKLFEYLKNNKSPVIETTVSYDWLALAHCDTFMRELKNLVGATQTCFDLFYQPVLRETMNLLQKLGDPYNNTYNNDYGLLRSACERTIAAITQRKDVLLPVGSEAETIYRERDHWTYAVFVIAMTRDLWKTCEYTLKVISNTHKEQIYDPLLQLNESPYLSIERKAEPANDRLNMYLLLHRLPNICIQFLSEHQSIWRNLCRYWLGEASVFDRFLPRVVVQQEDKIIKPKFMIEKIEEVIQEGGFKVNEENSCLQGVKEGLFVVLPDFLSSWEKITQEKISQEDLLAKLRDENSILPNEKNKNYFIHEYFLGHGVKQISMQGFVLDKLTSTITINDKLRRSV